MKLFGEIVVFLLVVAVLLSLATGPHKHPPADCAGRVQILTSAYGDPLECVCEPGMLSTCVNPGP